jgi:hypothetical protein
MPKTVVLTKWIQEYKKNDKVNFMQVLLTCETKSRTMIYNFIPDITKCSLSIKTCTYVPSVLCIIWKEDRSYSWALLNLYYIHVNITMQKLAISG